MMHHPFEFFMELEEITIKDESLRTAFQNWETLIGKQEEVLAYEARMKRVLDEEAAVHEAEITELDEEYIIRIRESMKN